MAKPYRRKKNGKLVGSFRATIDGRDLNLETKDASEAHRRARLATQGKWPVSEAAANAAAAALDPAEEDSQPEAPAESSPVMDGGAPQTAALPVTHAPSSAGPVAPLESLADAAAAAAAEVSGSAEGERVEAAQLERESSVDSELAGIMAELGKDAGGADLLSGVCDGVAAFLLWGERKAIELGVNWTLARRKDPRRLVTAEVPEDSLMRKSLRVGLKGMAVIHFPDLSTRLTPGWAIAIGMVGGAGMAAIGGKLVNVDKKTEVSVADSMAAAQSSAPEAASAPPAA
jgi:hypothetical protein